MAGTKEGGLKASITNKRIHGEDFYSRIGRKGGQSGHIGGFNCDTVGKDGLTGWERAKVAGKKGGLISRRGKAKKVATRVKDEDF